MLKKLHVFAFFLLIAVSPKNNGMDSLISRTSQWYEYAFGIDQEKELQERIAYMTTRPEYFVERCYVGDIEIIKRVLPQWSNTHRSYINRGMMQAMKGGHARLVKLLLENGANANIETPHGDNPIILALKYLHSYNTENDNKIIQALLHYGTHIYTHNIYQETALHWCADLGNIAILKQLLCESFFDHSLTNMDNENSEIIEPHSLKLQCLRYVMRNQNLYTHDNLSAIMNSYAIYDDIADKIPREYQKQLIASLKLEHHSSSHLNRLLSAHCQRHLVCIKHELDKKTIFDTTPLMQAQKNNHHDCAYFIRSIQKAEHFRQLDLELRQRIVANIAQKLAIDLELGVD